LVAAPTDVKVPAGNGLLRAAQKTATRRSFRSTITGSVGAIGWHNSTRKSILICMAGAFCAGNADRARGSGCARQQDIFTRHFHKEKTDG
jgi:hypothetical protein